MTGVAADTVSQEEMEELVKHEHVMVVISRTEPTCTEAGALHKKCTGCDVTEETPIPALGHMEVYTVIRPATASENGLAERRCARCGLVLEQIVLKKRASLIIDGLDYLYSKIPDGNYVLEIDEQQPLTITQNDNYFTIDSGKAVFEVENGILTGSFEAEVTVYSSGSSTIAMVLTGATDGNSLYVYVDQTTQYTDGQESNIQFDGYATISGMLGSMLASRLPADPDEIYSEYSVVIDWLTGSEGAGGFAEELLKKFINATFAETAADGSTVYTFDKEKFADFVNGLDETTAAEALDAILGEGVWTEIDGLLATLTDGKTKVSDLADRLFAYVENSGITKEQLFDVAGKLISDMLKTEIDLGALVEDYADKLIPDAIAGYMSGSGQQMTAEQIAEQLSATVEQAEQMAASTLADIWSMLQSGNVLPPEAGSLADLAAMLDKYSDDLAVTATVKDGKLISLSATYITVMNEVDGSTGEIVNTTTNEIFTLEWSEDNLVPQISLNFGQYAGSLEGDENAAELIFSVMGIDGSANYEKTEGGAIISAEATMPASDGTEIALGEAVLTVTNTANGADVDVNVILSEELLNINNNNYTPADGENDAQIEGIIHLYKDPAASAEEIYGEHYQTWYNLLYHADIEVLPDISSSTRRGAGLEFVSDESGEYYIMTLTTRQVKLSEENEGMSSGCITETLTTLKLNSIDGLPDMIVSINKDCGDWLNISLGGFGNAQVVRTDTYGIIEYTPEGYIVENGQTETYESTQMYSYPSRMLSTSFYYNPVTGETSNYSPHVYSYTAHYTNGSTQCGAGSTMTVVATCVNCGYSYSSGCTDHAYVTETEKLATQCGEGLEIHTMTCLLCGEESISLFEMNHKIGSEMNKTIITEEQYDLLLQELTDNGYTPEDAEKELSQYYFTIETLTSAGEDTAGFYFGMVEYRSCSLCGVDITEYIWYTHSEADGCLRHEKLDIHYDGNDYFAAFDRTAKGVWAEHHYDSVSTDVEDPAAAADYVESITGRTDTL